MFLNNNKKNGRNKSLMMFAMYKDCLDMDSIGRLINYNSSTILSIKTLKYTSLMEYLILIQS